MADAEEIKVGDRVWHKRDGYWVGVVREIAGPMLGIVDDDGFNYWEPLENFTTKKPEDGK